MPIHASKRWLLFLMGILASAACLAALEPRDISLATEPSSSRLGTGSVGMILPSSSDSQSLNGKLSTDSDLLFHESLNSRDFSESRIDGLKSTYAALSDQYKASASVLHTYFLTFRL